MLGLAVLVCGTLQAQQFTTRVVATGLTRPVGIVAGADEEVYFTEVPNPGVQNAGNAVKVLDLVENQITTLHQGDPEPVNLALGRRGQLYWTCKSAGVILTQDRRGNTTPLLMQLQQPNGIAIDRRDSVYFTQLPTPGVPGTSGGTNSVAVFDRRTFRLLHQGDPEPTDIAVGQQGEIYWTCKSAGVILTQERPGGPTTVLLEKLNQPVGIALNRSGKKLYWTEVPTPGVPGSNGGQNSVWELNLRTGVRTLVDAGDPEPRDVTVDRDGAIYWTCTSAGVIMEARRTDAAADRAGCAMFPRRSSDSALRGQQLKTSLLRTVDEPALPMRSDTAVSCRALWRSDGYARATDASRCAFDRGATAGGRTHRLLRGRLRARSAARRRAEGHRHRD
jgi:sugar lactone lactonase YvrE